MTTDLRVPPEPTHGYFFEFDRGDWVKNPDEKAVFTSVGKTYAGHLTKEQREELVGIVRAYIADPSIATAAVALVGDRDKEIETLHLQAAACMTATIQNTRESAKERILRDHPYWTQAYADICRSVDREIEERERAEASEHNFAIEHDLRTAAEAECGRLRKDAERLDWVREHIDWLIDNGISACAFDCQISLAVIKRSTHHHLLDLIIDFHLQRDAAISGSAAQGEKA